MSSIFPIAFLQLSRLFRHIPSPRALNLLPCFLKNILRDGLKRQCIEMRELLTFSQPGMTVPLPSTKDRGSCKTYVQLTFNLLNLKDLFTKVIIDSSTGKSSNSKMRCKQTTFLLLMVKYQFPNLAHICEKVTDGSNCHTVFFYRYGNFRFSIQAKNTSNKYC